MQSQYIDELSGKKMSTYFLENIPMNVKGMGPYPNFLAFVLVLSVTGFKK